MPCSNKKARQLLKEKKAEIIGDKLSLSDEGYYIADEIAIRLYDTLLK